MSKTKEWISENTWTLDTLNEHNSHGDMGNVPIHIRTPSGDMPAVTLIFTKLNGKDIIVLSDEAVD